VGEVQSITLPAPSGGINEYDAVDQMPPEDALELRNVFPNGTNCRVRGGITDHCNTGETTEVKALYSVPLASGTTKLVACVNNELYEVSTTTPSTLTGALTITSDSWNGTIFKNRLFIANGVNTPVVYDGSTAATTGFSHGGSFAQPDIISFGSFRNYIIAIMKNSTTVYYSGTADAITGAVHSYELGAFFKKGGKVVYAGSWTNQLASTSAELCVFISSEGEVLCYSGATHVGASDFALVARYTTGRPLGYRAFVQVENDLWIITDQGIVSLQELFSSTTSLASLRVGQKINRRIRMAAKANGFLHRWQGKYYPNNACIYINIPSGADNYYLVCNILTGAWCEYRFNAALAVGTVEVLDSNIYSANGAGQVQNFEVLGADDDGDPIDYTARWSWQFMGSRGNFKTYKDVRPLLFGPSTITVSFGVDTDFKTGYPLSTITTSATSPGSSSTTPWGSAWGSSWSAGSQYYTKRFGISGQGHSASFKLSGSISNAELEINAVDIRFEVGSQV
jgi:hypothetical protein